MLNNFRRPNSKTELGFITPNCNIRVNIYCIDCRVFVLKPEFRKFIWPTLTYDLRPLALSALIARKKNYISALSFHTAPVGHNSVET